MTRSICTCPREAVMRAAAIHFHHGFTAMIETEVRAHPDLVCAYPAAQAQIATQLAAGATYFEGTQIEAELWRQVGELFERYDALVVPTSCTASLQAGDDGPENAPTGVQIAGRTYDDLTVFRVGAALEAVRPWHTRPTLQMAVS